MAKAVLIANPWVFAHPQKTLEKTCQMCFKPSMAICYVLGCGC